MPALVGFLTILGSAVYWYVVLPRRLVRLNLNGTYAGINRKPGTVTGAVLRIRDSQVQWLQATNSQVIERFGRVVQRSGRSVIILLDDAQHAPMRFVVTVTGRLLSGDRGTEYRKVRDDLC